MYKPYGHPPSLQTTMGVSGLFEIIEPATETRSFRQPTLTEGFEQKRHSFGALKVGIDASIWLFECTTVFQQAYRSERYPALAALFYKLCELLRYSVVPVFVFDGPNRPDFKRGKPVDKKAHPLAG
ncbi:PIN domain-like protein [Mycena olivaceomarginata]|nr:PIN domain-like protein [Mycena olivaceomarginata]